MPNKTPAERAVEFLIAELECSSQWELVDHGRGVKCAIRHIDSGVVILPSRPAKSAVIVDFEGIMATPDAAYNLNLWSKHVYDKLYQPTTPKGISDKHGLALCAKLGIDVAEGEG